MNSPAIADHAMIRRLLVGRSLSLLGTAIIPTALILAIIEATQSGTAVGVVLACELVPQLVLLPVGGVIADRVRPQRLAFITDVVRGVVQLAIGVELLLGWCASWTWPSCRRSRAPPSPSARRRCPRW